MLLPMLGCCLAHGPNRSRQAPNDCTEPLSSAQLRIEAACDIAPCQHTEDELSTISPLAPEDLEGANVDYWDLTLQHAIELGLQHSEVLRDLGGTVLRAPSQLQTIHDPALTFTHPTSGEEAALSAFDTSLASRLMVDKNDRLFNNRFLGDGGLLQQDIGNYRLELSKRSAMGTRMAVRNVTEYDHNNSFANRFGTPSTSWTSYLDAEVRHPLLQGGGLQFNRIAGPGSQPGVMNGVLLARIRTDTSLADFESGVRNLVSEIENAYWDLYFAYRDFAVKRQARDHALRTYTAIQEKYEGKIAGESEVQQALEQYWRFEAEMLDSLNGRLIDGTRTFNGSSGGTFRSQGGVRLAERRLRLLLGLAINDGSLLRPSDEPTMAPCLFDWESVTHQAVSQRPELRRQQWVVTQRELELAASRNFLLPQLDAIARYRIRGFGRELVNQSDVALASALGNLADGDYQEWQLGFEFNMPIGFRRAHSAVRHAELQLARERAILTEQKRNVVLGLSNAIDDIRRAHRVLVAQYNRQAAAAKQVDAIDLAHRDGLAPLDLLLEAQRRQIDAETRYHQARVEYALAIKNVHFEKGTLLEYDRVTLAERDSTEGARRSAAVRRARQRPLRANTSHDLLIGTGTTPIATTDANIQALRPMTSTSRVAPGRHDETAIQPVEVFQ